jgi:membrane protease YdiL (CAAX protease family)
MMEFSRSRLMLLAFLTEGSALLLALLGAWMLSLGFLPLSEHPLRDIVAGTLGATLPLAFFIFMISGKAAHTGPLRSLRKVLLVDVRNLFIHAKIFDLFIISLLAGFSEEFLFRGVLQAKFGIIIAGILFGLMHFITPSYALIAAVMGLYLGFFFSATGGLLAPIQLHFIYDFGALISLRFVAKEPDPD